MNFRVLPNPQLDGNDT